MKYLRKCKVCEGEFETNDVRQVSCSVKCRLAVSNLKIREQRRVDNNKKYEQVLDIPTCKICGWKSISLQNHLKTHNLTVQRYREQYNVTTEEIFHSSYTKQKSDRIKGERNPGYQHNGTLSSFSKNSRKYKELDETEKEIKRQEQIKKANRTKKDNNGYTTTLEYYTSRGFSVEEAMLLRTQRQTTFSLEKCIERYGRDIGTEMWIKRQEKWLSSSGMRQLLLGVSKISQNLFDDLLNYVNYTCYYATNGKSGINNEYQLRTRKGIVKLDFFVPSLGKIIEFDGDYWHSPTNPRSICREIRDGKIMESFPTYQILHVWESEYKQDKEGTLQKCLNFLKE